ncbi:hypothetical protein DL95DRAFT_463746 [Leptodontidium sp. 2 PMI_412]|nr:hypothetical protein DL95DRAFT_463746 [Leptodontidium sp. 2 PMI_412]
MPHATTGTAHACPGASGPVSLKNGNVIPAGNCIWMRMSGRRGWCRKHEHFCQLHNWTYSKKDECKHCVSAKNARKKEAETKGATKGATKGVTKAEHIDFWMSGKKLYISRLIKNTIHSPDTDPPGFLFRRLKLCIQLHLPATRQSPRCL